MMKFWLAAFLAVGVVFTAVWAADVELTLDDNSGASAVSLKNMASVEVGRLDSGASFAFTSAETFMVGPGTYRMKMLWNAGRGALRGGAVSGTQWDSANLGICSIGFGVDTIASGNTSIALGMESVASNDASIAIGKNCASSGSSGVSIGGKSTASGQDSIAIGTLNTAEDMASVAIGDNCLSNKDSSVALGHNNQAVGNKSFAAGSGSTASGSSAVAIGNHVTAGGGSATAMGNQTSASGNSSTAMGSNSLASGNGAFAMGSNVSAKGNNSIALGENSSTESNAEESFAVGRNAQIGTTGYQSVAMGDSVSVTAPISFALGRYLVASAGDAFVLGSGKQDGSGNLENSTAHSLMIGFNSTTPTLVVGGAFFALDVSGAAHASSFPTSSDRRLKTNITPLSDVLKKVENLQGVTFDWNNKYKELGRSTGRREIGLIAQDVEKQFPELVSTWGKENYRAVDYGRMTAVLIEAVKELSVKNKTLEERIKALEAKK